MDSSGVDSQNLRLFVALPLSREWADRFCGVEGLIKGVPRGTRWVPRENLHVTACFLGSVTLQAAGFIAEELRGVAQGIPGFGLQFRGIGLMPKNRPRMIWGSFEPCSPFAALVGQIQKAAVPHVETSFEKRMPIPHVTLARFKEPLFSGAMVFPPLPGPSALRVEGMELWESILLPQGAAYKAVGAFAFSGATATG